MQDLINYYFSKLCDSKFFKNDDEIIRGKAKDVIENLKEQSQFVNNSDNDVCQEDIEFITNEVTSLINKIKEKYPNENDVIEISLHPMAGFYVLIDKEDLLKELKEYYEELEEKD